MSTSAVKRGSAYSMLATEPVTMYVSSARFNGTTKRSMRSASGTQELPADFFEYLLVAPVGMLGTHGGALEVTRRSIERLRDRPPLFRRHRREQAHLLRVRSVVG